MEYNLILQIRFVFMGCEWGNELKQIKLMMHRYFYCLLSFNIFIVITVVHIYVGYS
jgi:cytochrome b subunit of formate dehydrogenase